MSKMNEPSLDPYKVLGVPMDARDSDIRAAYYKLFFEFLSNKERDTAQKQKELERIQQAYEILASEESRQKYDDCQQQQHDYDGPESDGPESDDSFGAPELRARRPRPIPRERQRQIDIRRILMNTKEKRAGEIHTQRERQYGRSSPLPARPLSPRCSCSSSSTSFEDFEPSIPQWRGPFVFAPPPQFSPSPISADSQPESKRSTNDSRISRFRRFVRRTSSHRSGSQSSRGSQTSNRSVGSQVSHEDTDRFDYILQAMDSLVDEEIKRLQKLQKPSWWHRSKEPPKNQCKEFLLLLQQMIRKYTGLDHPLVPGSGNSDCYRSLLDLYSKLKLALLGFADQDLSDEKNSSTYCREFGIKIDKYKTQLDYCCKDFVEKKP